MRVLVFNCIAKNNLKGFGPTGSLISQLLNRLSRHRAKLTQAGMKRDATSPQKQLCITTQRTPTLHVHKYHTMKDMETERCILHAIFAPTGLRQAVSGSDSLLTGGEQLRRASDRRRAAPTGGELL